MHGIACALDEGLVLALLGVLEEVTVFHEDGLVAFETVGVDDGGIVEAKREAAGLDFGGDAAVEMTEVAREHAEQVERAVSIALVLVTQSKGSDDERRAMT